MRKMGSFLLALLIIASLAGCATKEEAVETPGAIYATITTNSGETKYMTLQEINDIEASNSILFEDEYIGADITVTSAITKIGGAYRLTSWFDCDAYVELESGSFGCFFKPVTEEYAKTLRVGDTITVSGKIGMASVTGSDIYIFKDKISPY